MMPEPVERDPLAAADPASLAAPAPPDPFSPVADPDVAFDNAASAEVFARLSAIGESGTRLAVLTGPPGTGKTTMLRRLMRAFEQAGDQTILELMPIGVHDLAARLPAPAAGVRVTVGLDEAQALDESALRGLGALLTRRPDLRIVLVGHPELEARVGQMERLGGAPPALVLRLTALGRREVAEYIDHRWRALGVGPNPFRPAAVRRIARVSGGVPQVVNLLCSRLVHLAHVRGEDAISPGMVRQVARGLPPPTDAGRAPAGASAGEGGGRPRAVPAALALMVVVPLALVGADAVLAPRLRQPAVPVSPLLLEPTDRENAALLLAALPPELDDRTSTSDARSAAHPASDAIAPAPAAPTPRAARPATSTPQQRPGATGRLAPPPSAVSRVSAPPSIRPPLASTRRDFAKDAALLRRAEDGDLPAVRALLADGASPDARDAAGFTPLMLAAIHGHAGVLDALLRAGARVDAQNRSGLTPLMLAAINDRAALVQSLLDRGADVNRRTKAGWTALMYAAWRGHARIVRVLLARGADPHVADAEGWTALRYAAWRTAEPIPRADLLDGGAPGDVARVSGAGPAHREVIAVLRQAGAR